jgi:hypothetical protein
LGREFAGVLGCDCFSAYRRYMRECGVVLQFWIVAGHPQLESLDLAT